MQLDSLAWESSPVSCRKGARGVGQEKACGGLFLGFVLFSFFFK